MDTQISDYILTLIPNHLVPAFRNYFSLYPELSEIRFHSGAPITFTNKGINIVTQIKTSKIDVEYIFTNLIDNNILLCEPVIKQGYIPLKYNLRAGICGDVFVVNNEISSIRSVRDINIRIPLLNIIDCATVLDYIKENNFCSSILVISPPGCGKTTFLRSIAYHLSTPPNYRRVAVIDTSRELDFPLSNNSIADHFTGYPKALGIITATKYFSPQYIVCDEISTISEAKSICHSLNAGVPIIASAHGNDLKSVKLRKGIAYLLDKHVFNAVIEICTFASQFKYNIVKL